MRVLQLGALVALAGCSSAASSTDGDTTRDFAVGRFDRVSLGGSDTVRVKKGAAMSVVATGPAEALDRLDVRVDGTTLRIGRKPGWKTGWQSGRAATITVVAPNLSAAELGGSGNFEIDRVDGETFSAAVGGSGTMRVDAVAVRRMDAQVGGSGSLRLAGRADTSKLALAGSGRIDADQLATTRADLSLGGSGSLRAMVTGDATISVAGSGNVDVKGTDRCTISKAGSGEVHCAK